MAEGRDLNQRAPRWLDCLIWSAWLALAACFFWRVFECDGEHLRLLSGSGVPVLLSRLLGCAILPFLLVVTFVSRTARRAAG